jgi:hypothetical protein
MVDLLNSLSRTWRGQGSWWGVMEENGNFLELVHFRAETDDVLCKHLKYGTKNAKYTSKTIQNEFIGIVGGAIRDEILSEVLSAQFYSIIADQVTDIASKEQPSLCLCYVHNNCVQEVFVDFVELRERH